MERMTGQTTRLIDEAIQILFTNGSVIPEDHYYPGIKKVDHLRLNKRMVRIICRRLDSEHPGLSYRTFAQRDGFIVITLSK